VSSGVLVLLGGVYMPPVEVWKVWNRWNRSGRLPGSLKEKSVSENGSQVDDGGSGEGSWSDDYVRRTGGPVYPLKVEWPGTSRAQFLGKTLRDEFAGLAMQGLAGHGGGAQCLDSVAEDAYLWADAMLKARSL
jgi:hypothetical protein